MKHLSYISFNSMQDNGQWILPTKMHRTYCNRTVSNFEVGAEQDVDCEECQDAKAWEAIDKAAETARTGIA